MKHMFSSHGPQTVRMFFCLSILLISSIHICHHRIYSSGLQIKDCLNKSFVEIKEAFRSLISIQELVEKVSSSITLCYLYLVCLLMILKYSANVEHNSRQHHLYISLHICHTRSSTALLATSSDKEKVISISSSTSINGTGYLCMKLPIIYV